MIETTHFQTLVALARSQSFSRAAEDLGVTQSAISQSIRSLETKIEIKLFKRSGKKVLLTPEGEKLHTFAVSFLNQMEKTIDEVKYSKNYMSGKIRVGALTGIGKSWLAPEMLQFATKYDDLIVTTTLGFEADLIRDFENFKLDFLILPEDFLPSAGEKILLGEEKTTLVFPKSEKFDIGKNITIEELSKFPTVVFEDGAPLFKRWCKTYFGKKPKSVNIKYAINSHGNMLQAVIKELGIAVIPTHVLRRSIYRDKVTTLGKKAEVSNGKFYLVYHKELDSLYRIKETIKRLTSIDNPLSEAF